MPVCKMMPKKNRTCGAAWQQREADGRQVPLEIALPGPLNALKKPLLRVVKGTVVEKVLRDQDVIKEGML